MNTLSLYCFISVPFYNVSNEGKQPFKVLLSAMNLDIPKFTKQPIKCSHNCDEPSHPKMHMEIKDKRFYCTKTGEKK